MEIIRIVIDLAIDPLNYPIEWLIFSWLIWLVLKLFERTRPATSIMLIYSTSVGITFVRGLQEMRACIRIELCYPNFDLLLFLAEVAFWFIILFVTNNLYPKKFFVYGKDRWVGLALAAFATWYLFTESYKLISLPRVSISANIIRQTVFWLFLPWLIWLFFRIWQTPKSYVQIMLVYSVSLILTATRLWYATMVACVWSGMYCQETFSLTSFLTETSLWFIPLYALSLWVSKIESPNLSPATS